MDRNLAPCNICMNLCRSEISGLECKFGIPLGFMNCNKFNKYKEECDVNSARKRYPHKIA